MRDALFVLAVRNEINTTPHFDPVQSFSRLPCFLPSPVQQVAVEEDLRLSLRAHGARAHGVGARRLGHS